MQVEQVKSEARRLRNEATGGEWGEGDEGRRVEVGRGGRDGAREGVGAREGGRERRERGGREARKAAKSFEPNDSIRALVRGGRSQINSRRSVHNRL